MRFATIVAKVRLWQQRKSLMPGSYSRFKSQSLALIRPRKIGDAKRIGKSARGAAEAAWLSSRDCAHRHARTQGAEIEIANARIARSPTARRRRIRNA